MQSKILNLRFLRKLRRSEQYLSTRRGHYNTLGMLEHVTEYVRSIDEVTVSDITEYAARVLDTGSYSIGIINPRVAWGKEDVPVE